MPSYKDSAIVKLIYRPALAHLRYKLRLVSFHWLVSLKLKNVFSRKLKVGFGPVLTGEKTLHTRKWWIDPIVNEINHGNSQFVADIFFKGDDLSRFDIVVLVKNFDFMSDETLEKLKQQGVLFLFAIVDNPAGCRRNYEQETSFLGAMDGFIVCNPGQQLDIIKYNVPFCYIDTPNINLSYKQDYADKDIITILWEGTYRYMKYMEPVERMIRKIAASCDKKIQFIYFTNRTGQDDDLVKYVQWERSKREGILCTADIAVTVKVGNQKDQMKKPSTKVCTYMAAGIPVICMPSKADARIIEHGVTGYFAYNDADWRHYLAMLINNPALRQKIGTAGREFVTRELSIKKTTAKYTDFLTSTQKPSLLSSPAAAAIKLKA